MSAVSVPARGRAAVRLPALSRPLEVAAWLGVAVVAVAVRAGGLHAGLIYPDGYQYLLMAKGIAVHLTPTVQLGAGGDVFVPSVDAALKPLFPALVAALSPLLSPRAAASAVTVAAGGATVVLAGLLATRLTRSHLAGAVAALAALASPSLAYWSGFSGPDPLAMALALAAALAFANGRASSAGALGALCAASRPEWALALLAAAAAALMAPPRLLDAAARRHAGQALLTGAFVLAGVIALVRPPLAVPLGGLGGIGAALAAGIVLQLIALWASAAPRRAVGAAGCGLCVIVALLISGAMPALRQVLEGQWPLLVLAAVGLVLACLRGSGRPALVLLATVLLLGATYFERNPGSERYLEQLLPLACIVCGFVAAPGPRPRLPLATRVALPAVAVALTVWLAPARPPLATDTFAALAGQIAHAPSGPLVSVAPDAYGFLLQDRPQRMMAPGVRGLILLDGAQRAYEPNLTARGAVVARLSAPDGFLRPDGTVDTAPVLLVRGVVHAR